MSPDEQGAPRPPDDVGVDRELRRGLIFTNNALGTSLVRIQELSAQLYALTELLVSKGVVSLPVLDDRKDAVRREMMADLPEKWIGAKMLNSDEDKYTTEHEVRIDCEGRIHLCKAACCRLSFYLSHQDLEEAIVRWNVGQPYHIARREDGYCVHCDAKSRACGIHTNRPYPCRVYDCRGDKKIWVDFEKRIPNPELAEL